MEARRKGNWVAAFCAALCLLTTFAAGAWAGNSADFVSKTVADNISVTGGKSFTQAWTIKNTGTKTWDSDYKLRYMNGDLSSSHSSIKISGKVKPGKTYTFSMEMKAPAAQSSEKAYREEWKFGKSSDSTLITLWTQIVVPQSAPVVTDDYGNSCSAAADISLNSSKNGKIDFAGDNDYFKVSLSSKGTLKVETTGSTDTYGRLLDSSCKEIKHDDDDGKGDNFSISKSVSAGTYYVAVLHHSSTKTGSYTLNVNKGSEPPAATNPLNVPYLNQRSLTQPKIIIPDSACASASAAMILAYHGKVGKSYDEMNKAAGDAWTATRSTKDGLPNINSLIGFLKGRGFSQVDHKVDQSSRLYELIKQEVKKGNPLILRAKSFTRYKGNLVGHYMVITGYDGDDYKTGKVIVNDPFGKWDGVENFSAINRNKDQGSKIGLGLKYRFVSIKSEVILIHP